jgi:hypothetical protein
MNRYFEYSKPYYALICAESTDEADEIYEEQVYGEPREYENEFATEITEQSAREKYDQSEDDLPFDQCGRGVLLIDGSLL